MFLKKGTLSGIMLTKEVITRLFRVPATRRLRIKNLDFVAKNISIECSALLIFSIVKKPLKITPSQLMFY